MMHGDQAKEQVANSAKRQSPDNVPHQSIQRINKTRKSLPIFMGLLLSIVAIESSAVPAPKYLGIESFKLCLGTQEINAASFLCMQSGKPDACPETSWEQLKALSGKDAIPDCPATTASTAEKPVE
jgi:hypothetical protein